MRKLIFKNSLSLGDIVMLTAAVRDLHRCYPRRFVTDVRTSCSALWENNPHLTPLSESDSRVEIVECHYPLIDQSNHAPLHCLNGFIQFLNATLGLNIRPTAFHGDLHLSPLEKSWISQVHQLTGRDFPFWIIVAGGKFDYTIKWWDVSRYQQVVDGFRGRIQFVQVGELGHYHPRLRGVIDLRGRTNLRQLVRLMHHAQGVLCGVTGLMHLAAAVESKPGHPPHRPCVVVAGGREAPSWEAYPHHQFIHNVGALPCCAQGGCWRARTLPLDDNEPQDDPQNLCQNVVGRLPRCMDMITSREVIRRIEAYFRGGALQYLNRREQQWVRRGLTRQPRTSEFDRCINWFNARSRLRETIQRIPPPTTGLRGRGVVLCVSTQIELAQAVAWLREWRQSGGHLPIQVWSPSVVAGRARLSGLSARFINAASVSRRNPRAIANFWQLKPHSLLHCGFREVLLLDPAATSRDGLISLFDLAQFQRHGALFWKGKLLRSPTPTVGQFCDLSDGWPPLAPDRMLLDVERSWRALWLCHWLNEHPYFFHQHTGGLAGTFQLAFRIVGTPFALRPPSKQHPAQKSSPSSVSTS